VALFDGTGATAIPRCTGVGCIQATAAPWGEVGFTYYEFLVPPATVVGGVTTASVSFLVLEMDNFQQINPRPSGNPTEVSGIVSGRTVTGVVEETWARCVAPSVDDPSLCENWFKYTHYRAVRDASISAADVSINVRTRPALTVAQPVIQANYQDGSASVLKYINLPSPMATCEKSVAGPGCTTDLP
jgi:hypothetical protein